MIYTVTLNPAIDKTAEIPSFTAGAVNRITSLREDAGGKGINVSKCLKALGVPSVAVMILAGEAGKHLEELVKAEGLSVLCVQAEGQTRTNLKIVDTQQGQNTDINEPGPMVTGETLRALQEALRSRVCPGDVVIFAGSLPKGVPADTYGQWTEYFGAMGVRVFLDADGACMAEGVRRKPWLIKPNETELARVLGRPMDTQEQILAGGRELLDMGISNVVISMGGEGAFFLWEDAVYRAKSLSVPVRSTVGAGDSVVAAMACGLAQKLSREDQIRLAMAMGAASVMQSGTQAPDRETVRKLTEQVELQKL